MMTSIGSPSIRGVCGRRRQSRHRRRDETF